MKKEDLLNAIGNIQDDLILSAIDDSKESRPKRIRRGLMVTLAAALVLTLTVGVGAASGIFRGLEDPFAPAFRNDGSAPPLDRELVEKLGHPVGVSATDQGVTVTVDSVLRDRYTCTVVTSIAMPGIEKQEIDYEAMEMSGALDGFSSGGGYTTNFTPGDDTLQIIRVWESEEPFPEGEATMTIDTLVFNRYRFLREKKVEGKWELKFDISYEDLSTELPAGQVLSVEGIETTLDEITISPLSMMVKHTAEPGEADLEQVIETEPYERTLKNHLEELACVITKKDGTQFFCPGTFEEKETHMQSVHGDSKQQGEKLKCWYVLRFDQMLPLDEIQSITIEGVEIPLA